MRDSNEGMIELLDASNENNVYSALISHKINGEKLKLRFSIQSKDYPFLKQILEFRPFENTGVGTYRYFFPFSYSKEPDNLAYANFRVEQGEKHKQFKFKVTQNFVANLLWFDSIKDKSEIESLIVSEE